MTDLAQRAAAALELMPEEMQEQAIAFLYEQGEKLRVLKELVQEGLDDVEAGRVTPFDMDEIRAMAREIINKNAGSEV